jgi:hypothetical protein
MYETRSSVFKKARQSSHGTVIFYRSFKREPVTDRPHTSDLNETPHYSHSIRGKRFGRHHNHSESIRNSTALVIPELRRGKKLSVSLQLQ